MKYYFCSFKIIIILLVIIISINSSPIKGIKVPDSESEKLPNEVIINVVHILQNDNYSCATLYSR